MSAHEPIKFWDGATLSNLRLLHATYVTHTVAPHSHEGYVIGVIEQGAEQFAYRRNQHIAPIGSIVFINPGEMHTGSSASEHGWTYRTLYPSIELLQRAVSDLTGRPRDIPFFAEPVVHDPEMMTEISLTHRALEEQASALERESRLLWTLSRLILRYADDHPRPRPSTKAPMATHGARPYRQQTYPGTTHPEHQAPLLHLSPFHLPPS